MTNANQEFFNRQELAYSAGLPGGLLTTAYTTGIVTSTGFVFSLPVVMGSFLGVLSTSPITGYLSNKYHRIFADSPNLNALAQFTIRASTTMLGALIGLMVTSLLVTLPINPFAWPALVAGGVSAALIFALYWYKRPALESDAVAYIMPVYPGNVSGPLNLNDVAYLPGGANGTYSLATIAGRQGTFRNEAANSRGTQHNSRGTQQTSQVTTVPSV